MLLTLLQALRNLGFTQHEQRCIQRGCLQGTTDSGSNFRPDFAHFQAQLSHGISNGLLNRVQVPLRQLTDLCFKHIENIGRILGL